MRYRGSQPEMQISNKTDLQELLLPVLRNLRGTSLKRHPRESRNRRKLPQNENLTTNIICNGERLNASPLRLITR